MDDPTRDDDTDSDDEPMPTTRTRQREAVFGEVERGDVAGVRACLDAGEDIDCTSFGYAFTPVNLAARLGHADVVDLLIARGANLELDDSEYYTPLQNACANGHVAVAKALVNAGAVVNAKPPCGYPTFVPNATDSPATQALKHMTHLFACHVFADERESPLQLAASGRNLELVRMLLDAGADPTSVNHHGASPLDLVGDASDPTGATIRNMMMRSAAAKRARDASTMLIERPIPE